jgi:hypothetical protein
MHDLTRIDSILRWTRTDGTRVLRETIAEARETHPHVAREKIAATCRTWRDSIDKIESILRDLP